MKRMLYDLTEVKDYKAHYAQCSNRIELLSLINKNKYLKKLIERKYGCVSKKVYVGDINIKKDI